MDHFPIIFFPKSSFNVSPADTLIDEPVLQIHITIDYIILNFHTAANPFFDFFSKNYFELQQH